jgi:hypothetical protein
MTTPRFTEEETTARAQQLANEQGPGWEAITAGEQVRKDTAKLRYWRELALKELEAEEPMVLEVEASAANEHLKSPTRRSYGCLSGHQARMTEEKRTTE